MRRPFVNKFLLAVTCISAAVFVSMAYSHCQIPCGIYGDKARFDMIAENITTIEKSMKQITQLSNQAKPDMNQLVRWVQNKEKHADDTSEILTYYFMAQRVKPADKTDAKAYNEYVKKLVLLHEMLVHSMKAKQSTDLSHVEKLKTLLAEFNDAYFGKTCSEHGHKH
ncbi:MAG: superoxide dismutase [Ni] [Planctomycetota bacterium]|jgi:nickel superoxide dismutase